VFSGLPDGANQEKRERERENGRRADVLQYITTMFFKPTLQDLMDGNTAPPPGPGQPEDLGQPVSS
jgi:hypothetical protein